MGFSRIIWTDRSYDVDREERWRKSDGLEMTFNSEEDRILHLGRSAIFSQAKPSQE
jgi:hypothetical protein